MDLYLGIDVSTTATKAILINSRGEVVGIHASEYTFESPHPLWSEQDPQLWWQGAAQSIRSVLQQTGARPDQVRAVGLTGQMHGLVLLDEQGQVLRPAILWNDQRTGAECDEIRRRLGKERLIQVSGNDALAGFTAPKIMWVQRHEPDVFQKARHVLLPKDYVRYRLTGDLAMDKADGSGTLLMDLRERTWSNEILSALEIPAAWMPPLFEGPQITGTLSAQAAAATGLRAGTPVVAGGGDQAAQAVGVGAIRPGVLALTLGTSGVVFAPTDRPLVEPAGRLHAFCHAVPGMWHLMGVMLSAAGSLKWFHDTFTPHLTYDELVEPSGQVAAGAGGLLFLPYLTGERTPYPDPLARGAFVGLTVRHSLPHLTRAVLEGVAYGLRDSLELILDSGIGAGGAGPGFGRWHQKPDLAADPGRRAGNRAGDGQYHRRGGLWRSAAGGGRGGGLVVGGRSL